MDFHLYHCNTDGDISRRTKLCAQRWRADSMHLSRGEIQRGSVPGELGFTVSVLGMGECECENWWCFSMEAWTHFSSLRDAEFPLSYLENLLKATAKELKDWLSSRIVQKLFIRENIKRFRFDYFLTTSFFSHPLPLLILLFNFNFHLMFQCFFSHRKLADSRKYKYV